MGHHFHSIRHYDESYSEKSKGVSQQSFERLACAGYSSGVSPGNKRTKFSSSRGFILVIEFRVVKNTADSLMGP